MDFKNQAEMIRQTTLRYYVTYIGIDITGMGTGVSQLVKQFFPNVTEFSYSPEVKPDLYLKQWMSLEMAVLSMTQGGLIFPNH